ncbi:MAG: Na+/H+ antiporter NhaA [Bacteroidales bacterium]
MKRKGIRFPLFILDSLVVLPLGCLLALAWAAAGPESYYRFSHALEFTVNEVGIAFLFAVMTKEVVEATLPGGDLHPWRRAALPVAAAAGGVIVPVVVYIALLKQLDEPMLVQGWVVTSAIDVAACYVVGRLIFGRHPAVPFLLLLAIASDAIGLAVLAGANPAPIVNPGLGVALVVAAVGVAIVMRRRGVASFWPYLLVPGGLSWCGLFLCGAHPALAFVPIVPFMPHATRHAGLFVDSAPPASDALSRMGRWWAVPVQVVLFLFGLVNAGVPLHGLDAGIWAVPVATLVGRPLGILAGAEIAVAAGLHRTPRVGWRELLVIGFTASIGLTVALFFAATAMSLGPLRLQLKTGALLTAAGALAAFLAAWLLGVGRFRSPDVPKAGR